MGQTRNNPAHQTRTIPCQPSLRREIMCDNSIHLYNCDKTLSGKSMQRNSGKACHQHEGYYYGVVSFMIITRTLVCTVFATFISAWSISSPRTRINKYKLCRSFSSDKQCDKSFISSTTSLFGGIGVAKDYSWKEEQFEIEVNVAVPINTTAKDIKFKCSPDAIELRLVQNDGTEEEKILLNGERKTRGKISVDGTFWSIADADENFPDSIGKERIVSVTLEKHFVPISSVGGTVTYDQLTDFDWGGIYPDDDAEVSFRKYEEAEELNVKDYAAKLGVDLDNLDMSKVDKSMFGAGLGGDGSVTSSARSSGVDRNGATDSDESGKSNGLELNITQSAINQLIKYGLAKEIVRQGDGTEYETISGSLERNGFSMLGKGVSPDELLDAGLTSAEKIPDAWQSGVPVEDVPGFRPSDESHNNFSGGLIEDEIVENDANHVANTEGGDRSDESNSEGEWNNDEDEIESNPNDPIDQLSVARLKDILRDQGLKVSGRKQELRNRLREHVESLLQE